MTTLTSPTAVRQRAARTTAPVEGDTVTAACGCVGRVRFVRGGQYPTVTVAVAEPCPTGHPGKISAGVLERFRPDQVSTG